MDWGPGYREQQPPAGLLPSVACLWARVAGPGAGAVAAVLPDACVDLIWEQGRGLFVAGPDTGAGPLGVAPGHGVRRAAVRARRGRARAGPAHVGTAEPAGGRGGPGHRARHGTGPRAAGHAGTGTGAGDPDPDGG